MKQFILLILLITFALTGATQPYWQQQISYTIDVTLNDADRSLDGFIKINYHNNSPDTLSFIWIHCWPNAYKNDRTAFSDQLLGNGRTDFYFSDREQRGYINRLNFRVDDQEARMEDHPQYIDIIKVLLPHPLPPGGQITLSTPFHVKLPYNFSRGGYTTTTIPTNPPPKHHPGQRLPITTITAFQITQWYPKPAVYDSKGWHPIPYLDQGEFYSEFGAFDVHITVPRTYTIAATGEPHDTTQNQNTKTLHYQQDNIHDFAWFADQRFHVDHDTLQLPSGRIIKIFAYYTPAADQTPTAGQNPIAAPLSIPGHSPNTGGAWQHSIQYIKDAVRFRSRLIGEYPYNTVTAVQTKMGITGGMEYPTITAINMTGANSKDLDLTIEHEVGHNWFYGILGTDERRYPWMDEGINTWYDHRYETQKYPPTIPRSWLDAKFPADQEQWNLDITTTIKKDQPISTPAEDFTRDNYFLTAYTKTGDWMQLMADSLGQATVDSCMQEYYRRWQFKHPYPNDLQHVFDDISRRNTSSLFALLDKKGPLTPPARRTVKPTFLFNFNNTRRYTYINFLPAAAYNEYDKFMIGALIHNYDLPPNPFGFYLAPLYATGSHQLNGAGGLNYTRYTEHRKIELGISGERFSSRSGIDSSGQKITGGYYKLTPTIRLTFPDNNPRSTLTKTIEWKTYLIGEKDLDHYVQKSTDSLYYPLPGNYKFRYLNQLSLSIRDDRVLYPYKAQLQFQQAASWYRINFTGNYFFNYEKGGGLDLRVFAAKFGYIGGRSATEDLSRFQPKLTAVRGDEDYTYSNYFIGRSEFTGRTSQQIMMRDGDLKLRTDLFQGLQGRSDNWIASLNLNTTLPRQIVPEWLPLKAFLDIGTYSGAWQNDPPTSHFLYVSGLQLSFLKDVIRIYAPLIYSKDFSNQLKTVPDQNTFWKKLSFSIDLQNINFRKLFSNTSL